MDNPFGRCFLIWCSEYGLTTLPTLSAVGVGLGVGSLCTATALRGFFINDFFLGPAATHVGGPIRRRRFGRSGGALELFLRRQASERSVGPDPVEVVGEGVDAAVYLHEVFAIDLPAAVEFVLPLTSERDEQVSVHLEFFL